MAKRQRSKAYKSLLRAMDPIARQLVALQKQAKKFGLFTHDRELLDCPKCPLQEDVSKDGLLMTYMSSDPPHDTGLRFRDLGKGRFRCPSCKTMFSQKHREGE